MPVRAKGCCCVRRAWNAALTVAFCVAAVASYDFQGAMAAHVVLVGSDWSTHKDFLKGLKYSIQLAQKNVHPPQQ